MERRELYSTSNSRKMAAKIDEIVCRIETNDAYPFNSFDFEM